MTSPTGCRFKALILHFGRRHLGLLEPEVTITGREGGAEHLSITR